MCQSPVSGGLRKCPHHFESRSKQSVLRSIWLKHIVLDLEQMSPVRWLPELPDNVQPSALKSLFFLDALILESNTSFGEAIQSLQKARCNPLRQRSIEGVNVRRREFSAGYIKRSCQHLSELAPRPGDVLSCIQGLRK